MNIIKQKMIDVVNVLFPNTIKLICLKLIIFAMLI